MRRNSEIHSNHSESRSNGVTESKTGRRGILRDLMTHFRSGNGAPVSAKRGRLLLESLEQRQLMAGDVQMMYTDGSSTASSDSVAAQTAASQTAAADTGLSRAAEGESTADLVQFAKDLKDAGVIFYGAHWCPACTEQKQMFEDGAKELPFIEVTQADRTPSQLAITEGIESYPTWEFPDGSRLVGTQSLETLSTKSGVAIPQGETPSFQSVGNKTVQIGAPLHVPINAYDPDGGPLTVTVSVENPALLEAVVLSGNRSIRFDMEGYGDMVFELFEDRAPTATGRVIELANQGFYDGLIFHRVIDQFMIQGGDPTGTGTGGSTLGDFDDDFHPDLVHTGSGVLSFAKSGDDTNDSQFFITEVPTRHLDFNHSVFGQLVEGEDVREAISNHATGTNDKPTSTIRISSIDVFNDIENSVVMLKAKATGTTNVTYTVTDAQGRSYSETSTVSVVADSANSQPFLNDITDPASVPSGTAATLQLSSVDVEGDAVTYFATSQNANAATATVNPTTGVVTVTPNAGFVGTVPVLVGVRAGAGVTGNASTDRDEQLVIFTFGSGDTLATPTGVDLAAVSDVGISNSDNITSAGTMSFIVSGVTSGATVELVNTATNTVIGVGAATGSTVTITTNNIAALGDGTYNIAARQHRDGVTSARSAALSVVYDTSAPASVIHTAATQANVGRVFRTDLISSEEGAGLVYKLTTAPAGATINAATGEIVWTPTTAQTGGNTFTLELTDAAGNTRTESFSVDVLGEPLAEIKLTLTDLQGQPITAVQIGQEFNLNMIGVDARTGDDLDGIFAAFADILYNSNLIRPVPGTSIQFSERFSTVRKGALADGLIDELGAATDRLTPSQLVDSLIATIRMEAIASGSVNIRSEPADAADSEVLLYGNDNQIPAEAVAYGSVQLAIGQNFTVADDTITVAEDSGVSFVDVLANDNVLVNGGTLSLVSVTQPTRGAAVSIQSGKVALLLDDNFNGDFEFTYRVRDSQGIQEDATVTVTVTPVNDPPSAADDTFNVDQGSSATPLDVLLNDSIAPDTGESLRVSAVGTSANGATITISQNGQSVLYTPPANFVGSDTFTYTVTDGSLTDQATVSIVVAPADPPPTAVADSFTVVEDAAEALFDVLVNDTRDASNEEFTIIAVGTPDQGGAVRANSDGSQIYYKPAANFNGTEKVTYTIRDSGGGIAVGTVTFTVTSVNDAPPIANPTFHSSRGAGEKAVFTLSDLPANVDSGETLTFSNLGTPTAGGSVRINAATGTIFYTPPSDTFSGTDTFTYTVNDGTGLTRSGTITIEVSEFTERDLYLNFLAADISPDQINGIVLKGTDATNNTVEVPLSFTGSKPSFQNIMPGNYVVEIPAIPFFGNGSTAQQLSVTSAAEDGDTTIDVSIGQLLPQFISIRDWLGSTPKKSLLVAVQPGQPSALLVPTAAATNITNPVVTLDATSESIKVSGTKTTTDASTGAVSTSAVEASLPTNSDPRVQMRGESGGMRLYRISIEEADVTFTPASTTANGSSSAAAQGEFIETSPAASTVGAVQADAGTMAVNSVSQTDVFVPVAEGEATRSDATVMPLSGGDVWVGESLGRSRLASSTSTPSNESVVDNAMTQVATELTRSAQSGETIAEEGLGANLLSDHAIDAALTGEL